MTGPSFWPDLPKYVAILDRKRRHHQGEIQSYCGMQRVSHRGVNPGLCLTLKTFPIFQVSEIPKR